MDDVKADATFPLPVEPRPRLAFRPPYSSWQISALINWGRPRLWPSRIKWISGRTSRIPAYCLARYPFAARPCRRNQWWSGWWNNNRWSRNTTTLRIERTQRHLPQSLSKIRSSPRRWDLFLRPEKMIQFFSILYLCAMKCSVRCILSKIRTDIAKCLKLKLLCPFFVFFEIILESFYINLNLVILPLKSQVILDIMFEEKRWTNEYIGLNSVDWKNKKNLWQNRLLNLRILEKYLYSENFSFRLINLIIIFSFNQRSISLLARLKIEKF